MTYRCPKCQNTYVKVTGPPIIVHFDEEGPTAFEYDDNPVSTLNVASPTECVECGYSAFAEEFIS
jgi:predicted Zn-ribbon and HTH transcriptional regulator